MLALCSQVRCIYLSCVLIGVISVSPSISYRSFPFLVGSLRWTPFVISSRALKSPRKITSPSSFSSVINVLISWYSLWYSLYTLSLASFLGAGSRRLGMQVWVLC